MPDVTAVQLPRADRSPRTDRALWWLLKGLIAVSFAFSVLSLHNDLRNGASIWKQGDWLINSVEGPIRRGPTGTWTLHLADFLGVNPVTVVVAIQLVLAVVLYGAFYRAVTALEDPRVALLLSISPGMFLMFWLASIHHGSLRKELIGMAALALMVCYLRDRRPWMVVGAAAIMAVGVWSHEITILFGPVFVYLAWLASRLGRARLVWAATVLAAVSGAVAAFYALRYTQVPDVAQVCDPLRARDVSDRLCDGAIKWLTADGTQTVGDVQRRNVNPEGLAILAATVALSAAPLAYLGWLLEKRRVVLLGLAAALLFVPLFVIVVDWGRWISCGVFAFTMVLLAHALTSGLALRRPANTWVVVGLAVVGSLLVPYHVNDVVVGGIWLHLHEVVREFARVVV